MKWKKGRGRLGIFQPVLGTFVTESDTEMGPVKVTRTLQKILDNKFIQLDVLWEFDDRTYTEHTMIGVNEDKEVCFWAYTSQGKHHFGKLADVTDAHPDAIGFEAQMPAGLGRQAYYPHPDDGFVWIVESHSKKGWNRFVEHHYLPKR